MQGALLKGVQSFNDQMLSRWRVEGFLDFASSEPKPPVAATIGDPRSCAARQGHAAGMLRTLLAAEKSRVDERVSDDEASRRDRQSSVTESGGGGGRLVGR